MYQPRRTAEGLAALDRAESDRATAFRAAPRRASRSRADLLRTRVAPTVVSVALLATSGAFALNLKASEGITSAVPAPVREDEAASRNASRELATIEQSDSASEASTEAPADEVPAAEEASAEEAPAEASTEEAPEQSAELAEAFVGGTWAAAFGTPAGDKFAQGNLNVRAQASGDSAKLGTLEEAEKVGVTDKVVDGWRQVTWRGQIGYVLDKNLGDKAPAKPTPKPSASTKASSSPSTSSASETFSGSTTYTGKSVLGLKPKAMVVYNAVTAKWSFSSIGGYRASSLSNHQLGGAIDFMLTPGKDSAKGWAVANYLAANASALGIDHIIFEQKIWTPYKPTWRAMANRGSTTANHYDHVHVSVKL